MRKTNSHCELKGGFERSREARPTGVSRAGNPVK